MALSAGTRLGPYEILEPLGAGGMGEVYRARDTRLDRTVALKVLPAEIAADPQLRARFEREARAISALAHPNICTLHDVGEQDGRTFLVMEHLVGETLAERLKKGPLPLEQALEIATQIADALSVAHKQGIVHRDLKPANVMLTKTGARLLDFGLARLTAHGEQPTVEVLTSAPTEPEPLTARGTIMGTLPYMAPEQVEGKPADPRTDLWALGTVLYEMLTGERPFQASNPTSMVGAILEREPPPLREGQPLTPPSLERLVRRCLAKDPDERWDTAHDVADELRWVAEAESFAPAEPTRQPKTRWGSGALAAAALLVGLFLGAAGIWILHPASAPAPVLRSQLNTRPTEGVDAGGINPVSRTPGGSRRAFAWAPDGEALIFVGRMRDARRLYLREMEGREGRPLDGTEGAQLPTVSPDGQWVAFWSAGAIRKIPLPDGPPSIVVDKVPRPPAGMAWGREGHLLYAHPDGSIRRAGSPDAAETIVARPESGESYILPSVPPGEDVLLFTARTRPRTWGDEEVVAQILTTGETRVLVRDAVDARYIPGGYLAFLRRGVLHAVPFDLDRLQVEGPPVALIDGVAQALLEVNTGDITGAGQFDVAPTGTLAYIPGQLPSLPERSLVSVDRRGLISTLPAPPRSYAGGVRVAPDGRRLAVAVPSLTERSLWVLDSERGTLTRLTRDGEARGLAWSPEGERIVYSRQSAELRQIAWLPVDGVAQPAVLADHAGVPSSWSADGRHLALTDGDIWIATLADGAATMSPLIQTSSLELYPEFSPGGNWLAYVSDESGRAEVYVQPFPGPGPRQQLSVNGGCNPAWNPSGGEVFFLEHHETKTDRVRLMSVTFGEGAEPRLGLPRVLFEFSGRDLSFDCLPTRCYDVSADGERFFATGTLKASPRPAPVTHIHLVQNWLAEVKARVPTN